MRNILCDKSNTCQYFDNVGMALPENVKEVSDPSLVLAEEEEIIEDIQQLNSREIECLVSVMKIGVSCSMSSPEDRTPISTALNQLHAARGRIRTPN